MAAVEGSHPPMLCRRYSANIEAIEESLPVEYASSPSPSANTGYKVKPYFSAAKKSPMKGYIGTVNCECKHKNDILIMI